MKMNLFLFCFSINRFSLFVLETTSTIVILMRILGGVRYYRFACPKRYCHDDDDYDDDDDNDCFSRTLNSCALENEKLM